MRNISKRTFTLAAASLTGHATAVTGAAWVIATAHAADGISHHITIRNNAAVDHSAKTIVLVGLDANGSVLTETMAAPGISATVTSTKAFKELTGATPSATIGADTFDIGWAATGHTPYVDTRGTPVAVAVYLASGACNFDIQHTLEELPTEDSTVFMQTALTGKTATVDGSFTAPIAAVRVDINSHTAGVITFVVLQGE